MSLLPSLGLVFLSGLFLGELVQKLKLPPLLGYLLAGILLGQGDILSETLTEISPDLREIALLMILLKAGLTLSWNRVKAVGKSGFFLAFCPASFEILSCLILAPVLFDISYLEAALLGSVLSAVSPAVVVPRMVGLIEKGCKSKAPETVLAGASLDDVFVILLFTSLLSLSTGEGFSLAMLLTLPLSIIFSMVLGGILGKLLSDWTYFSQLSGEKAVLFLLGLSFLFLGMEEVLPLSALLAVLVLGLCLEKKDYVKVLSQKFTSLWEGAQLLLFVLVGAEVSVEHALDTGLLGILLLGIGLIVRSFGVYLSTMGGNLSKKERRFIAISYLPKATVQAGIGGIPLALGLDCGELVLSLAVLAILITAPLGAILMDQYSEKLLEVSP